MEDLRTPQVPDRESGASSGRIRSFLVGRVFWPLTLGALVVAASSRSHVASPEISNIDKFAHFLVYGLLATLVCRVGKSGWRTAALSFLIVVAFGATDEWHQSFVPGRSSDFGDLIADTIGAACAIGLYTGWTWYRQLLEMTVWRREAKG